MKFSILSLSLAVVVCISSTAGQEGSRRPVCPNKCPRCFPRFVECKFGEEKDFCGCCTICYKGEAESCGTGRGIGDGGKCADGLYCVPKFNVLFPLFPQERVCRYNHHICMAPCHKVRCIPPPTCTFGRAKDTCGCCDICLQTPGEFCGEYLKCGTGLDCIEPRPNQGACRPRYPEILYALEKLQV